MLLRICFVILVSALGISCMVQRLSVNGCWCTHLCNMVELLPGVAQLNLRACLLSRTGHYILITAFFCFWCWAFSFWFVIYNFYVSSLLPSLMNSASLNSLESIFFFEFPLSYNLLPLLWTGPPKWSYCPSVFFSNLFFKLRPWWYLYKVWYKSVSYDALLKTPECLRIPFGLYKLRFWWEFASRGSVGDNEIITCKYTVRIKEGNKEWGGAQRRATRGWFITPGPEGTRWRVMLSPQSESWTGGQRVELELQRTQLLHCCR